MFIFTPIPWEMIQFSLQVDEDARPSFSDLAEHFDQVIRLEAENVLRCITIMQIPTRNSKRCCYNYEYTYI